MTTNNRAGSRFAMRFLSRFAAAVVAAGFLSAISPLEAGGPFVKREKRPIDLAADEKRADELQRRARINQGRELFHREWQPLLAFNEGACAAELGLDTEHARQAKAPSLLPNAKPFADTFNISKGIDIFPKEIEALSEYIASLPAPRSDETMRKMIDIRAGEKHFYELGCIHCHKQNVGDIENIYSDLLLHRVGLAALGGSHYGGSFIPSPPVDVVEKADPERPADPDEFRTPPLWGVADSAPYLDDGRAHNLHQAISLHGGQAERSRSNFLNLHQTQQMQVVAFLNTLKAPIVRP